MKQAAADQLFQARVVMAVLAALILFLVVLFIRAVRRPDSIFSVPRVLGWRIGLVGTMSVILITWILFWYSTLGVQLIAGFPYLRAIDFLPPAFAPLSPMVIVLAGIMGAFGFIGARDGQPSTKPS